MNPDFRDLLALFNAHGVDYLVVGGYAVAAHGHVRATKDLDVWVRPSPVNAPHVIRALVEFGAPLHDLTEADLSSPGIVFQIGVPPIRIDVLTSISAVEFEPAWLARVEVDLGGLKVRSYPANTSSATRGQWRAYRISRTQSDWRNSIKSPRRNRCGSRRGRTPHCSGLTSFAAEFDIVRPLWPPRE
jgi:hypothetical protein